MPLKPRTPCSYPGCPRLTYKRFCDDHLKAENRRYNQVERAPDFGKRYDGAWKRARARYIAAHPLCERCQADGRITPAELVHHKLPLADGGTHDAANLLSVCKPCHAKIHRRLIV
jgi:5-methylcytosine-specific restriction protein A